MDGCSPEVGSCTVYSTCSNCIVGAKNDNFQLLFNSFKTATDYQRKVYLPSSGLIHVVVIFNQTLILFIDSQQIIKSKGQSVRTILWVDNGDLHLDLSSDGCPRLPITFGLSQPHIEKFHWFILAVIHNPHRTVFNLKKKKKNFLYKIPLFWMVHNLHFTCTCR